MAGRNLPRSWVFEPEFFDADKSDSLRNYGTLGVLLISRKVVKWPDDTTKLYEALANHLLAKAQLNSVEKGLPTVPELFFAMAYGPSLHPTEFIVYKLVIDYFCATLEGHKLLRALRLK